MADHKKNSTLVYSTETGRICAVCGHPKERCRCVKGKRAIKGSSGGEKVRIAHERKGRRGKGVTLITGLLEENDGDLKDLARKLKKRCGTGGTVKGGTIEIQGDQREILRAELKAMGKI